MPLPDFRIPNRVATLLLGLACLATGDLAAAAQPDFTGLWTVADVHVIVKPDDDGSSFTFDTNSAEAKAGDKAPDFSANFTESTKRLRQEFLTHYDSEKEDQIRYCVPHGMPWMMLSRVADYLIDIYQTPDRITMLFEGMDASRVIHFHEKGPPATFIPSTNGYAVAHWDGNTLVIETTALKARSVVGLKQRSAEAKIVERWTLIQHPKFGKALDIDMTVTDPVVYLKPATGHQLLIPAKPGSTLNMYGCNESLWQDHLHQLNAAKPR